MAKYLQPLPDAVRERIFNTSPTPSPIYNMSYAYLFKYIIIGDTGLLQSLAARRFASTLSTEAIRDAVDDMLSSRSS